MALGLTAAVGAARRRLARLSSQLRADVAKRGFVGAVRHEWEVRSTWPRRTERLVDAYTVAQAALSHSAPVGYGDDELEWSRPLVENGRALALGVAESYRERYSDSGLRILVCVPPFGAGHVWMNDLVSCLRHTGIAVDSFVGRSPGYHDHFSAFRPNVYLGFDEASNLRSLHLGFIADFKRRHGLLRLLCTYPQDGYPGPALSADDRWRLALLDKGMTADAFFSPMVEEHYVDYMPEWSRTGVQCLSLPMGVNPLTVGPRLAAKDLDWTLVTNNADDGARAELTERYMSGILVAHRGVLAGAGWGTGVDVLPHAEVPALMARARISPYPLTDRIAQHPSDIGPKTFEIPACGCFALITPCAVLDRFFAADEIAVAATPIEYLQKFEHYLGHAEERYAFIARALRRVFAEHTYFERIDRLVRFVQPLVAREE